MITYFEVNLFYKSFPGKKLNKHSGHPRSKGWYSKNGLRLRAKTVTT